MIGKYVVPMQTLFIIKDFMQCYVFTYSCKLLAYRITLLKKQFTAEKFEVFENYYFWSLRSCKFVWRRGADADKERVRGNEKINEYFPRW